MAMTFATDINTNGYTVKADKISAPTSTGSTVFGLGSNGHCLRTNGTTLYWSDHANTAQMNGSSLTNWRPLLMGKEELSSSTGAVTNQFGTTYTAQNLCVFPTLGRLKANSYQIAANCKIEWNATDEAVEFNFV